MTDPIPDGCPGCLANVEEPQETEHPDPQTTRHWYRCTDCGHRWWTDYHRAQEDADAHP